MVEEENSQLQRVASKVLGNNVTVVLGSQWGDEGKGKLVDILCDSVDVCARCQGGNNAGHTIVADKIKYDFHILPSGLLSPSCLNLVGSGCVVNIPSFFEEINKMKEKGLNFDGRLFISDRVHLVFAYHEKADALKEQELGLKSIGTTGKGIGPCYSNKASRSGVRMHHLINDWPEFERRYRINLATRFKRYGDFEYDCDAEIEAYRRYAIKIKPYVTDAIDFLHSKLESKKKILVEGANALMLDLDFGTYPFVTSSNTTIGGAMTGLGISPKHIDSIIGVLKAYTTRVGQGPFPTELYDAPGELLQQRGKEWGVTTGRKRRCGWLDLVQAKFSCRVNGYTSIMLTKLDVLDSFEEIKIGTQYKLNDTKLDSFPASSSLLERVDVVYETLPGWNCDTVGITEWKDLPKNAQAYVEYIEDYLKVPILLIGTGPSRDQIIVRDTEIKS